MQHPCCSAFYFLIIQTLALRDSHLTREIEFFLIISMSLQCKYCDYATGIVIGYETRWSLFWQIQAPLWKESDFTALVRIYQAVLWDDCCKFPWYFLSFVYDFEFSIRPLWGVWIRWAAAWRRPPVLCVQRFHRRQLPTTPNLQKHLHSSRNPKSEKKKSSSGAFSEKNKM